MPEMEFSIREQVAQLGREGVPLTEIAKQTGKHRATVERWLLSEDIQPVMLRGERKAKRTGSLRGSPVALRIEEGVRKRIEEMERQEAREARERAA